MSCHRLRASLLSFKWSLSCVESCFASLMPWDTLALAVLSFSPSSEGVVSGPQQPVNVPCQPWPPVSLSDDAFCVGHIMDALGDGGGHRVCVLLNVCVVVVGGCLLKHSPVCCVKAVLKSRGGPLWSHSDLLHNHFGDFHSVCVLALA